MLGEMLPIVQLMIGILPLLVDGPEVIRLWKCLIRDCDLSLPTAGHEHSSWEPPGSGFSTVVEPRNPKVMRLNPNGSKTFSTLCILLPSCPS